MKTAIGRGEESDWIVDCPSCSMPIHYAGFFDPQEPCACQVCDCEFLTTEIHTDSGDIIK